MGTADDSAAVPAPEGLGAAEPLVDSPVADGLGELVVEVGLVVVEVGLLDVGLDEDGGDEVVAAWDVGADVGLGLAGPVVSGVCPLVCVLGALGEGDVAGVDFAGFGLSPGSGR